MSAKSILLMTVGVAALLCLALYERSRSIASLSDNEPAAPAITAAQTPRIARPIRFRSPQPETASKGYRDWIANPEAFPQLSTAQVEPFLNANHRNAISLLAAFRTTGNPKFLAEAEKNFPNDPRVDLAAALKNGATPAERQAWIDKLKQNDPANAMGNYLAAYDASQSGQTALAFQNIAAAAAKPALQNYLLDSIQSAQEAYQTAGFSELDAKVISSEGAILPELSQFKQLGRNLSALAGTYQQSGDAISAQAAAQAAIDLGSRLNDEHQPLITSLTGLAIEKLGLTQTDPAAPYGNSGQTVQDQLDQIARQQTAIHVLGDQQQPLLQAMPASDIAAFFDRRKLFGDMPALQWAANKYGN